MGGGVLLLCVSAVFVCRSAFECPWWGPPRKPIVLSNIVGLLHSKLNGWGRPLSYSISLQLACGIAEAWEQVNWFYENGAPNIAEQLKSQQGLGPFKARIVHNNGNQCTQFSNAQIHAKFIIWCMKKKCYRTACRDDWVRLIFAVQFNHCLAYRYFMHVFNIRSIETLRENPEILKKMVAWGMLCPSITVVSVMN